MEELIENKSELDSLQTNKKNWEEREKFTSCKDAQKKIETERKGEINFVSLRFFPISL